MAQGMEKVLASGYDETLARIPGGVAEVVCAKLQRVLRQLE